MLKEGHYHAQVESVNDCLYRYMDSVEFILFMDTDELIVPHGPLVSLHDLLRRIRAQYGGVDSPSVCAYSFNSNNFLTGKKGSVSEFYKSMETAKHEPKVHGRELDVTLGQDEVESNDPNAEERNYASKSATKSAARNEAQDLTVPLVDEKHNHVTLDEISHLVDKYDIKSLLYWTRYNATRLGNLNKVMVLPRRTFSMGVHRVRACVEGTWYHVIDSNWASSQHYRFPPFGPLGRLPYADRFKMFFVRLDVSETRDATMMKYAVDLARGVETAHIAFQNWRS